MPDKHIFWPFLKKVMQEKKKLVTGQQGPSVNRTGIVETEKQLLTAAG